MKLCEEAIEIDSNPRREQREHRQNGYARTCKHTPEQALSAAKRRSRAANARGYHAQEATISQPAPRRTRLEMAYGVGREHVALTRRIECASAPRPARQKLACGIIRRRIDFRSTLASRAGERLLRVDRGDGGVRRGLIVVVDGVVFRLHRGRDELVFRERRGAVGRINARERLGGNIGHSARRKAAAIRLTANATAEITATTLVTMCDEDSLFAMLFIHPNSRGGNAVRFLANNRLRPQSAEYAGEAAVVNVEASILLYSKGFTVASARCHTAEWQAF